MLCVWNAAILSVLVGLNMVKWVRWGIREVISYKLEKEGVVCGVKWIVSLYFT